MRMNDLNDLAGGRVLQPRPRPAKAVTREQVRAHLEGFLRAQARSRKPEGVKHHAAA